MVDERSAMVEIRNAILADRERHRESGDRRPGEFTTKEYARENGISRRSARRDLLVASDKGIVKKRKSGVANVHYYTYLKEE